MTDPKTRREARYRLSVLETKSVRAARQEEILVRAGATASAVMLLRAEAEQASNDAADVWALLPALPE